LGLGKAVKRNKRLTPDGATTSPECLGLTRAMLVDVVVKEVLEFAYIALDRRIVVVGAKCGCHIGLVTKKLLESAQRILVNLHVGVHE
jgi:hypothetical protein